jgi:phage uncharacterized protein TIGR01671
MHHKEIKFRAWIKPYGQLVKVKELHLEERTILTQEQEPLVWNMYDCVLMPHTGLQDKNGVEIYEWDLVNLYITPKKYYSNLLVYWESWAFYIKSTVEPSPFWWTTSLEIYTLHYIIHNELKLEVVGNIYS